MNTAKARLMSIGTSVLHASSIQLSRPPPSVQMSCELSSILLLLLLPLTAAGVIVVVVMLPIIPTPVE